MSAVRGGRWSSREGLSARQVEQEHVSINLDHHIDYLRDDIKKLKQVGMAISEESSLQKQLLDSLEGAMESARGAMKTVTKKLNKVYRQSKSNHMLYLVLFAMGLFFLVYSYKKAASWLRWLM